VSGRLVSFEGGEGAGKSTVIAAVESWLQGQGITVLRVREPGGTPTGEAIRALLLDPVHRQMCAETELLLMFASRAQLVREQVQPALARGDWVLADRFTDASFAYQGGGRGIEGACIAELERWTVGFRPHRTLLLDIGVDAGMDRARSRDGGGGDRIEQESRAFFERVRASYRQQAAEEQARWRVLDATQPATAVAAAACAALADLLPSVATA
jgi:dTMP kinase